MERWTSMKTFVLAALSSVFPAVALAQGLQVSIFGDAGVVAQSNKPFTGAAGATYGTSTSLNSGPWQASRIGFRGKFKLSDDFDAWYEAATTVNLTQGLIGNPTTANSFFLFDRAAFVGVSSKKYGNLTLGRHPAMVTEALWVTDPLKANNGATNPNVRFGYLVAPGTTIYSNFGPNPGSNSNGVALDRQSNSVKYVYGNSGFLGMAMYGLGGAAGDLSRNLYAGALLGYDSDGAASHGPQDRALPDVSSAISLRAAFQVYTDNGTVAGTAAAPNVVSLYAWTVGGVGRYGPLKLKATFSGHSVNDDNFYKGLTTTVASAGVTYAFSDLDLTVAAYNVNRKLNGQPDQSAQKFYIVPEWYLIKNFWIYAIADYEVLNAQAAFVGSGAPAEVLGAGPIDASGTGGNTLWSGARNTFYFGLGISFYFGN